MTEHKSNIADIRTDYRLATLDETTVGDDPVHFFNKWFHEAQQAQITEVNAMAIATVDEHNKPHARIVLLKDVDEQGFVFFTNYDSHKAHQLANNSTAALLFFWKELERQVRIEGIVEKVSEYESDTYFHSRPEGSRIGAWASPQSQQITDRKILELSYQKYTQQFANGHIPRPPHWGGYRVIPQNIEFWQGRSNRLHDRIFFTRLSGNSWGKSRLAP